MEDPAKRIRKIQDKINNLKAQKIAAVKAKDEVTKELSDMGIKSEDLEKIIAEKQSRKDELEVKLEKILKEAEDVLARNQN
jgi:chromosome segregation ATPase